MKETQFTKTGSALEVKGKDVEFAITAGLNEMHLSFDQVTVEILDEGSKGFLGFGRSAVVRLTPKQESRNDAVAFLNGLFSKMGVSAQAHGEESEGTLHVNIDGDSTGILIGRHGEMLDALQYLTSLVVNRGNETFRRVQVDTENYRKKREETLVRLANRIAQKVTKTGRRVVLEPMNPCERRIFHATLQNNPNVETVSEGEEPYRRVVVRKTSRPKQ